MSELLQPSVTYRPHATGGANLEPLYLPLQEGVSTLILTSNIPCILYHCPDMDWNKRLELARLDTPGKKVITVGSTSQRPIYLRVVLQTSLYDPATMNVTMWGSTVPHSIT